MKSFITYTFLLASCMHLGTLHAQKKVVQPRIGQKAPAFVAESTEGQLHFPRDFTGQWVVLFSYPADFTPVCTSEITNSNRLYSDFKALNTELIALSTDPATRHKDWKKELNIQFPLITDTSKKVAQLYNMIHPQQSTSQTIRSVYIVDPSGIIRTIMHYPMSTGRSFSEIIRTIKALQIAEAENVLPPAEWQPGDPTLTKPDATKQNTHTASCPLTPPAIKQTKRIRLPISCPVTPTQAMLNPLE